MLKIISIYQPTSVIKPPMCPTQGESETGFKTWPFILTQLGRFHDHEGASLRARLYPLHSGCATPVISPKVGNLTA